VAPFALTAGGRTGMSLCLAIATRKEYRAVLAPLGAPAAPVDGRPVSWRHGGRDMTLLLTGVGPVAAAATLGRLLGAETVDGVVNLGLAGAYDLSAAPLTALVTATAETLPEYGLRREDTIDPRGLGFPQLTVAGKPVYDRLDLSPTAAAVALGLTLPAATVPGVFASVAGVAALPVPRPAPDRLAENMEGFALALVCRLAGVPFLELRAVSNRVGARPPVDWDLPGALAALSRAVPLLLG